MTIQELQERQAWSLEKKIDHSLYVIEAFLHGVNGMAYVSFSGGRDSTVLLDLVRMVDKSIPAVFVNTGQEHPENIYFVHKLKKEGYNITEVHPKMKVRQIWEKYGFPLISKAQSEYVYNARYRKGFKERMEKNKEKGTLFGVISKRWQYLLDEPYDINNRCCDELKKKPAHRYQSKNKRFPIIGTMAAESTIRTDAYLRRGGCNSFKDKRHGAMSLPLSIWTDKDIEDYIKLRNLPISKAYSMGWTHTGCLGCGFGCQYSYDERFKKLYSHYPKYYEMILNHKNHGVTFREALRKVFKVTHRHLPDEQPLELFPVNEENDQE